MLFGFSNQVSSKLKYIFDPQKFDPCFDPLIISVMAMYGKGHSHSHHSHEDIEVSQIAPTPASPKSVPEGLTSSETKLEESQNEAPVTDTTATVENEDEIIEVEKPEPRWSVIGGILVGDCFHNFVDGLAVGVAWTLGWGAGLGKIAACNCKQ